MGIIRNARRKIKKFLAYDNYDERIRQVPKMLNEVGYDDWGMNPEVIKNSLGIVKWIYEHYFRTKIYGIENVPEGRVLIVANHGGQIPIDAMLLCFSLIEHGKPPRILRAMIDRFVPRLPFISTYFARMGQIIGTPENCVKLLEKENAVLIFPEGTKGLGKLYWNRYKLQKFGAGFMRLALQTNTPIVPVAVIGTEETYPCVHNSKTLANLLKIPYFPITPFWPLLGPLGFLPMPTKVRLHFGKPMYFTGEFDDLESNIRKKVDVVSDTIKQLVRDGLKQRKGKIFS